MQRFDCLSPDCPLLGPHLLEASAGTGKTFSIEHIFVRLLLQSERHPIELEQILAVTFTRAATRELKKRIRDNVEKAIFYLKAGQDPWGYLKEYFDQRAPLGFLKRALETFDRCHIFTIHGFCYRMLKEFAFEANLGIKLPDPDKFSIPESLQQALKHFLNEGIHPDILCLEQIGKVMKKEKSMQSIKARLLKRNSSETPLPPFCELQSQFEAISRSWPGKWVEEEKLQDDFASLSKNYKSLGKNQEYSSQLRALANLSLSALIEEEGTVFQFLDPSNLKIRTVPIDRLHYPGFFDWAKQHLEPLITSARDPKKIFSRLSHEWEKIAQPLLYEENHFQFDDLLFQMKEAIQNPLFLTRIEEKYRAVIIDEFQDTDPLQWEIFRALFIQEEQSKLDALYLVGDPKQSIYRFRKADVYTYFDAKNCLGEAHLYHLDTNFRSSPPLIDATNALFSRDWLPLPKIQSNMSYHPVRAGSSLGSPIQDEKGALHWIHVKPLYRTISFKEQLLPYAVQEIERLYQQHPRYSAFAILVKDRYQVEDVLELFKKRGIPAKARSHLSLGETEAFRATQELFLAIQHPLDASRSRTVLLGPFGAPFRSVSSEGLPLSYWKFLLEEEGLASFAKHILNDRLPFYSDAKQIFEELFSWELKEGFSLKGLIDFLDMLKELDPEEGVKRRMDDVEDAVQILTIHISKGLEFDVVFALGLAFSSLGSDEDEAEMDAEKLRQLYVAMTRAKFRLYVPLIQDGSSPMALFCRSLESQEGPLAKYLQNLGRSFSLSYEEIEGKVSLALPVTQIKEELSKPSLQEPIRYFPSYLHSFTSLASHPERSKESVVEQDPLQLPLGSEVGIVFHQIFEKIFSFQDPVWRDKEKVRIIISQELYLSRWIPWEETIFHLVWQTLNLALPCGFSLQELEPSQIQVEMEFFFFQSPHFVKGFIDLVFCHQGTYYLVDWKSNTLKKGTMNQVMDAQDYWLQASLYAEALKRHLKGAPFGGALYFFLREGGCLYFMPEERYGF